MSQLNNTTWVTKHFSDLSVAEVYEMLRLRSDVFVVYMTMVKKLREKV